MKYRAKVHGEQAPPRYGEDAVDGVQYSRRGEKFEGGEDDPEACFEKSEFGEVGWEHVGDMIVGSRELHAYVHGGVEEEGDLDLGEGEGDGGDNDGECCLGEDMHGNTKIM